MGERLHGFDPFGESTATELADAHELEAPLAVELNLVVQDPETVAALVERRAGADRDDFALSALRIGVLALRQARGQVDARAVERECQRMLSALERHLNEHTVTVHERLSGALSKYFDPDSGAFHDRVERLIKEDGELERVIRRQIGEEDSQLARTLAAHFGRESPLLKMLSPSESEGLMAALRDTMVRLLGAEREAVLKEFSLDNEQSALRRMIAQLTASHGQLTESLQLKIDDVVKEFSLDEENSALSRLVRNVDRAQRTITSEFSLDNDQSALSRLKTMLESTNQAIHGNLTLDDENSSLARLKRELLQILDNHSKSAAVFQEEVKVTLAKMQARKEEADRSTRHGLVFEQVVYELLFRLCQAAGDEATFTGSTVGAIKNCKKGDCVIRLGPDSAAPDALIVIEAKEEASFTLRRAREEIAEARDNRRAGVGFFAFSKKTAPIGMEPVGRYGSDVVVVWDAEDASTDVFLKVGLTLAKALAIRSAMRTAEQTSDFTAIESAILEVCRRSEDLGKVTTWTETIQSNSEKIIAHIRNARKSLDAQVEILQTRIADLKQTLSRDASGGA